MHKGLHLRASPLYCKHGHQRTATTLSPDGHCRPCARRRNSASYHKDPAGKAKYRREYMARHPTYLRNHHLKRTYGMTLDDYTRMLEQQNRRCKICPRTNEECSRGLVVDHDHVTGKVRGLLCDRCNLTLGLYETQRGMFEKYLEEHSHA